MVTAEQLATMQFESPGRTGTDSTYKSPYCSWTATGQSIQLIPVTTEGIEEWTDGKRQGQSTEADPVEGFPAITVILPDDLNQCDLFVDTAEGQYLSTTYSVSPSFKDRFPEPCDGARKLAEAAMQNLLK